jgi:hypothetical protein
MPLTNVYTGAFGTLVLANEDTPEGSEASTVIEFYELQTVGRVREVSVWVNTRLEEFHEVGRRHATSLHAGNVSIGGEIGRAYINGALLFLLLGRGARPTQDPEPFALPAFNMVLRTEDPGVPGNSVGFELKGVKLQSWAYTLPEDDFVLERVTFKALTISNVETRAPEGGGEAIASAPEFPAVEA